MGVGGVDDSDVCNTVMYPYMVKKVVGMIWEADITCVCAALCLVHCIAGIQFSFFAPRVWEYEVGSPNHHSNT